MKLTKREFGEWTGFSLPQVGTWLEQGMPQEQMKKARAAGGMKYQIDTCVAIPWLLRLYKSTVKTKPVRELVQHEQARRIALDNAKVMGKLLEYDKVEALFLETISNLANELEGIPGRMANELAGITDPARIRARLLEETRRVRSSLAGRLQLPAQHSSIAREGGGDPGAASAPKRQPVGGREAEAAPRKRRARRLA